MSGSPAVANGSAPELAGESFETAIGTGRSLPHYATEAAVTGVDLSPQMLALARETAATLGREVDLRQADAAALPFDEASFDTAVCVLALCSIPNPGAAIAEMFRVLKPGGEPCCSTMSAARSRRCTPPSGWSSASPAVPRGST